MPRLYRTQIPRLDNFNLHVFSHALSRILLLDESRTKSTYLSCEESADATEARADSAGRGCDEYGGRVGVVERWDGSRSADARGDGSRTSTEGAVLGDGGFDRLCTCARGLLSDLGSKWDALTRGFDTEAVLGEVGELAGGPLRKQDCCRVKPSK